ncbi:MAG: hypothetical protein U1E89_24100 [Burkholderiaceae bacterium]
MQVPAHHGRQFLVKHKPRLGDRFAVANRAGCYLFQAIPARCAAAGAPTLSHVLSHAGQALGPAHKRVVLVERLQHGTQNHVGGRIVVGEIVVDEGDASLAAVALEHQRNHPPTRDPRGVQHQNRRPRSCCRPKFMQHVLETRAVLVLPRFHGIGEFSNHDQTAGRCGRMKRTALRINADVRPVFARAQIQCRAPYR